MRKFFWRILLTGVLAVSGTSAFAQFAALAMSDEKGEVAFGIGIQGGETQVAAEQQALSACVKSASSKPSNCLVKPYTVAISRAASPSGRKYLARSFTSVKDAENKVKSQCGKGCRIEWTETTPGIFVVYDAMNGGAVSDFYLQYGGQTLADVDGPGKANCEKNSGLPCTFSQIGVIKGRIPAQAPAAPVKAQPISEKSCRPNTPTIRCSSQCTNGNCVITYENGCKMRVQVQPKFDPFNNQWTYPAPSC